MIDNTFKILRESKTKGLKPLSQQALSEEFESIGFYGINRQVIGRLERGQTPNENQLSAYSTYFNVTTDFLLGLRNTAPVDENIAMINKTTGLSDTSIEYLKAATDEEIAVLNAFVGTGSLHKLSSLTRNYYRHIGEPMKLGDTEVGIENKRGYFDMILSQKMLFLFKDFIENTREIYNLFTRNVLIDKIEELREKGHSVGHPKEVIDVLDRSYDESIEEIRTHDYYADYIESQKGSD